MPEPTTSNRRWRSAGKWIAVTIAVLLAGTVAWSFRPLTRTERELVGGWSQVRTKGAYDTVIADTLWFRTNRRFEVMRPQVQMRQVGVETTTQISIQQGSWGASGRSLFETNDVVGVSPWKAYLLNPMLVLNRILGRNRSHYVVRFEGPDRLWVNDIEFERVKTEP